MITKELEQELKAAESLEQAQPSAEDIKTDGNLHVLARQKIGHTDFPLEKIVLYVEDSGEGFKVILLPSEH